MSNVSKENMLNRSHNNEKLILLSESEIIKMSTDIENEVAKIQTAKTRYQGLIALQWLLVIFFGFSCNYLFLLLSFMSVTGVIGIIRKDKVAENIYLGYVTSWAICQWIYYSLVFKPQNNYIEVIAVLFMLIQTLVFILILANRVILYRKPKHSCVIEIPKTEI